MSTESTRDSVDLLMEITPVTRFFFGHTVMLETGLRSQFAAERKNNLMFTSPIIRRSTAFLPFQFPEFIVISL